jgi:hypothetical protein
MFGGAHAPQPGDTAQSQRRKAEMGQPVRYRNPCSREALNRDASTSASASNGALSSDLVGAGGCARPGFELRGQRDDTRGGTSIVGCA